MKTTARIFMLGAIFCATVLAIATTTFAGPERINPKEPIVQINPEERFDWSGFYVGGNIGASWTDFKISRIETDFDIDQADAEIDPFDDSRSEFFGVDSFAIPNFATDTIDLGTDDSLIGGGQIGYQHQFGSFVIGVEGDFERSGASQWATFHSIFEIPAFSRDNGPERADMAYDISRKVQTQWTASARAKVGFARGPVLIYATGGVAFAQVDVTANDSASLSTFFFGIPVGSTTFGDISKTDDTQVGWTAGGGVEWAANNMFSIAIEGRHSDFGSETYHFASAGGPIFQGPTRVVDLQSDMVMLKFNVLLNHFLGH